MEIAAAKRLKLLDAEFSYNLKIGNKVYTSGFPIERLDQLSIYLLKEIDEQGLELIRRGGNSYFDKNICKSDT